jgi:hypothetical protein
MNEIENTLKSTKGRFFTLVTKQGESFNAQLIGMTPCYARLYDRNKNCDRLIAKTSVLEVRCKNK